MSEKLANALQRHIDKNAPMHDEGLLRLCVAALRASPAEEEPINGDAAIKAAASEAAPGAQVVRSEGDWLVYYSGFNLSKFVRFLARTPRAAVSPPQREEIARTAYEADPDLQVWRTKTQPNFTWDEIKALPNGVDHAAPFYAIADAILALYPAGDGREADSLSGEEGKSK